MLPPPLCLWFSRTLLFAAEISVIEMLSATLHRKIQKYLPSAKMINWLGHRVSKYIHCPCFLKPFHVTEMTDANEGLIAKWMGPWRLRALLSASQKQACFRKSFSSRYLWSTKHFQEFFSFGGVDVIFFLIFVKWRAVQIPVVFMQRLQIDW